MAGTRFQRALGRLVGGVNSPVRAFGYVGGEPRFMRRGEGCVIEDEDGTRYIDHVMSFGPLILGHAHPKVVEAVCAAAARGTTFGAPTWAEVELAELVHARMPSLERIRLVNSGTEATMTALRLARAATGRENVVTFAGCYHGHADPFLVTPGSGALTLGIPSSAGVPPAVTGMTLSAPYNDLDALEAMADRSGSTWAAIMVEPVAGNMGVVAPDPGFLPGLRALCDRTGALLVFDEVMTGFRLGPGGAQERYGVTPDLTCLGKIVGGGLPLAAVGGRAAIMDQLAPLGPVYQAGTLSGNPLATAAGLATLQELEPEVYARLEALGAQLASGLEAALADAGVEGTVPRVGSMWSISFRPTAPRNLDEVKAADTERFAHFFHGMLAQGVYLAPSPFEAMFLSAAHGEEAIAATVAAARRVLSSR